MKSALITGASGLLGSQLSQLLIKNGYITIGLTHKKTPLTSVTINKISDLKNSDHKHLDLVINLAGAPIASKLWTKKRKQQLLDSRCATTASLIQELLSNDISVSHFISGSAIGYYGTGFAPKTESSEPGTDFSAHLCVEWERQALQAQSLANTVTILRTGLVLTSSKGYLEPLIKMASFGINPIMGKGDYYVSWIDHRDWLYAVMHIINHNLSGAFNLTAPKPIPQKEFASLLTKVLGKKPRLHLPSFLYLPMGEMQTLLLEGQLIEPDRLLNSGFHFTYNTAEKSLSALFGGDA